MKTIVTMACLLFVQLANADQGCVALSKFVGTYKQISKSCDSYWFGPTLDVAGYSEYDYTNKKPFSGFWITSGPGGNGPTTLSDGTDLDKCTTQGNKVIVQICGNARDNSCLGRDQSYVFSGSQVLFMAENCSATFEKQ